MIYFENLSQDPWFNQAFEETIFEKDLDDDVLLVWRNRPAVVCGRYQNIFAEVDVRLAEERDITLIRRISGGGTVYHDPGNINYSFIRASDSSHVSYGPFLNPVRDALEGMGVKSEIILSSAIAVDGKKISGSAQRKVKDRVLHHGTLLYDCDLSALRSLANGEREHYTSKGTPSTPWPVTNLRELVPGNAPSAEEFMARLLEGFRRQFMLKEGRLHEEDLDKVERLVREKYQNWQWTFGKNPSFSFSRRLTINGLNLELSYTSSKGIIDEFNLTPQLPQVKTALEGQALRVDVLKEALAGCPGYEGLIRYIL